jgi:D-glycero-D-manno-heptose 1,7-bisphosphate phosphatase
MKKKNTLICIDRDGTLIHDDKYYLGKQSNWKKLLKFHPGVIEGIKILNKIPNSKLYILTNQSGIAVKEFKQLTLKRANEVCKEILIRLDKKNAHLDGYFICPHVPPSYAKKYPNRKLNKKLVCNCTCIKPKPGMVYKALKDAGLKSSNTNIYVIGDRFYDAKTALNVNGFGILIKSPDEPFQEEKLKKLSKSEIKNTHIANNFLDASKFIMKRENVI